MLLPRLMDCPIPQFPLMGFGNPQWVLFKDEHRNDIRDCLHPNIPIELP